ncbi:mono/diheme cytochrome c family protein [Luteibacter sp. HA06]
MERSSLVIMAFIGLLGLGCTASRAADDPAERDAIERGKYIATAADCAACHTAKGGKAYAGGMGIRSPVGTMYASNITPSKQFGIGQYTEKQFSDAVRHGIRRDGRNLYPGMPYTSYALLTDEDIHFLYVYVMQGIAPVDEPAPETDLPFPMNLRASMAGWNLLFLTSHPYVPDTSRSAQWNRGRYLAEGAAHCSTCHSPRGLLMQEETDSALSGGSVGPWYAPNITSDPISGIGLWQHAELVQYLRSGHVDRKAQAAGSMGEAVEHSFQHLSDDDLDDIAIYIQTVPGVRDANEDVSRFQRGAAKSNVAAFRGMDPSEKSSGAQLFQGNCASCHIYSGQGTRDGYYPSLFHNSATGLSKPTNLIATILNGVDRTTGGGQVYMPAFGGNPNDLNVLSDAQIAALANYVLSTYGNGDPSVTANDVAIVRQGGPTSHLVAVARVGMTVAALAVAGAIALLVRRRRRRMRQR